MRFWFSLEYNRSVDSWVMTPYGLVEMGTIV